MQNPFAGLAAVIIGCLLVVVAIIYQIAPDLFIFPGSDKYCEWLVIAGFLMSVGLLVIVVVERGFWQILGLVVAIVALVEGIVCMRVA